MSAATPADSITREHGKEAGINLIVVFEIVEPETFRVKVKINNDVFKKSASPNRRLGAKGSYLPL